MNFLEAKKSATKYAMSDLKGIYFGASDHVLSERFIEHTNFWMFFQRDDLSIPPEAPLSKFAYACSRYTDQARCVADLRDEPEQLAAYLDVLAGFFERDAKESEELNRVVPSSHLMNAQTPRDFERRIAGELELAPADIGRWVVVTSYPDAEDAPRLMDKLRSFPPHRTAGRSIMVTKSDSTGETIIHLQPWPVKP